MQEYKKKMKKPVDVQVFDDSQPEATAAASSSSTSTKSKPKK